MCLFQVASVMFGLLFGHFLAEMCFLLLWLKLSEEQWIVALCDECLLNVTALLTTDTDLMYVLFSFTTVQCTMDEIHLRAVF